MIRIGNGSLIMAYVHVAHDCQLGGPGMIVAKVSKPRQD